MPTWLVTPPRAPVVADGTLRLQAKVPDKKVHVMAGTRHGNFMDAIWWLPKWVTRGVGFSGKSIDPHDTYTEFVRMVAAFIDEREWTPRDTDDPH